MTIPVKKKIVKKNEKNIYNNENKKNEKEIFISHLGLQG